MLQLNYQADPIQGVVTQISPYKTNIKIAGYHTVSSISFLSIAIYQEYTAMCTPSVPQGC